MQQQQREGPITTAKAFQRITGAHTIIVSLLLADIVGVAVWLLIGALIGPPIWWLLRACVNLLHTSLILDIGLIVIGTCLLIGFFRRRVLRSREDAWLLPGTLIFLCLAALGMLWLIKPDWMGLPARVIPTVPLEAISFQLVFVPQGAAITAGLSLLAHLLLWWRTPRTNSTGHLALSRAPIDGPSWRLLEQAYDIYRHHLSRFDPPPITSLKTPPTFYYYQKATTDTARPEQEMYWRDGELVINRAYIGPKEEQADILLPLLARLLYDYNTPDQVVEKLFHLAHLAERMWLTEWLLAVPLYVQMKCEQQWEALARERVLDRDRFAYFCGQGPRLRKWLRLQLKDRTENGQLDNTIPTLAERIEHLDSLLFREEQQVQHLRDALAPPPATPAPSRQTEEQS
jgi:hypothetical protein